MIAVAAGSFALAFGALANEGNLQSMDTNKDGMVSAAEHAAGARQMFKEMDADTDGRVTATEMGAAHRSTSGDTMSPAMSSAGKIRTIDADHDGVISAAEHDAGSRECSRRRTSTATDILRKRSCRPAIKK